MNSARNLQIVSLYFMLATGLVHFFSGLMYVNEYLMATSLLINKISDLPFLASAIIYLGASLKLSINPEPNKKLDITLTVICVAVFIGFLIINLALNDKF